MSNEETNQKPSEMKPEDLPDVRAFQDKFTRSFLQSTEETEPGYYPFLSGTGAYQMDFPADGVIADKSYSVKEGEYEGYFIGVNNQGRDSSVNILYASYKTKGQEKSHLESLEKRLGEDVQFDKIQSDNQTLYRTYFEDGEEFVFAGYLQNELTHGGIEIIVETGCPISGNECQKINNTDKENIERWIKSIQFIDRKESE